MAGTAAISAPHDVVAALETASARTGAEFDYLYKTALRESGLKTAAKAPTSSASGLFQFIEQTWFETFKQAGPKHGLGGFADDISKSRDGRYIVADPAARQEILALRNDPVVASVMAGELTSANRAELKEALGREPSDGELYIGHFLGPSGAAKLVRAAATQSETRAADLSPGAARANRSIFYDRSGEARSAGEVYRLLVAKHSDAAPPRAVASDVRERISPFTGIIAFFEYLFSGGREEPRIAPAKQTAPQPFERGRTENHPAVTAYLPEHESLPGSGDAARLFALRARNGAYEAQAAAHGARINDTASQGSPARAPDLWGGGLFTNTARAPGPLILIGSERVR